MTDLEYEAMRTDWKSLFVHDPVMMTTRLMRGVSRQTVKRRYENYQRWLKKVN